MRRESAMADKLRIGWPWGVVAMLAMVPAHAAWAEGLAESTADKATFTRDNEGVLFV
jgi:hypothetical protein